VIRHQLLDGPAVAYGALAGVAAAGIGVVTALGVATRSHTQRALARQQAEHARYLSLLASEFRHPLSTVVMSLEVLHPDSGVAPCERDEVTAIVDRQMRRLDLLVAKIQDRGGDRDAPVRTM
jgi:hypothetical protein